MNTNTTESTLVRAVSLWCVKSDVEGYSCKHKDEGRGDGRVHCITCEAKEVSNFVSSSASTTSPDSGSWPTAALVAGRSLTSEHLSGHTGVVFLKRHLVSALWPWQGGRDLCAARR
jgi:hypothetical protein